jgi:hypothetical protein
LCIQHQQKESGEKALAKKLDQQHSEPTGLRFPSDCKRENQNKRRCKNPGKNDTAPRARNILTIEVVRQPLHDKFMIESAR